MFNDINKIMTDNAANLTNIEEDVLSLFKKENIILYSFFGIYRYNIQR